MLAPRQNPKIMGINDLKNPHETVFKDDDFSISKSRYKKVGCSDCKQNCQNPGVAGNGDLALKRDRVGHILHPRASMALIICAPCTSQPRLSECAWVHMSNSRQNPGVTKEGAEKRRIGPRMSHLKAMTQYMSHLKAATWYISHLKATTWHMRH